MGCNSNDLNMIIKKMILPAFCFWSVLSFAQKEWTSLDVSKYEFGYGMHSIMNPDGSFELRGYGDDSKSYYKFDESGNFEKEVMNPPVSKEDEKEDNQIPWSERIFVNKTEGIITVGVYNDALGFTLDRTSQELEWEHVDLEVESGVDVKGKKVERINAKSGGIISVNEKEFYFYHFYKAASGKSHPGLTPVKGKNYSFIRIGKYDFKTKEVTFEYVFVDQFTKHPDIPVGKPVDAEQNVHLIAVKNNRAVFGFTNYSAVYIYVKTGSVDEALKAPETMTGYYEIGTVDLKSFSEEILVTEQIQKPKEAFSLFLYPTDYGFSLSWSKRFDRTVFESHADLIEVGEDLSINKTSLLLPVEDLPMRWGIPLYLREAKDLKGNKWFVMNEQFSNSKRRKDIKDQASIVLMINRDGEIEYRDNSSLEWSVNGDHLMEAGDKEDCLPCLRDFSAEELQFASELPAGESVKAQSNTSLVASSMTTHYLRKGSSVYYVQIFEEHKMNARTGEWKMLKLYTRTGEISL